MYTHQVTDSPDSIVVVQDSAECRFLLMVPAEVLVPATSVRILLISRVSADRVLYDYVTDLTYSNGSYICTHDLV